MKPEHEFGKYENQEEWDRVVFENAAYFTVLDATNRTNLTKYATLKEAVDHARQHDRLLLYAITDSGRYTCLPRSMWPELLGEKPKDPTAAKTAMICKVCGKGKGKLTNIGGETFHPSCWRTSRL